MKRYHLTIKNGPNGHPPVQNITLAGVTFRRRTEKVGEDGEVSSFPGCVVTLTDEQLEAVKAAAKLRVVRWQGLRATVYLTQTTVARRDADGKVIKVRDESGEVRDLFETVVHPAYKAAVPSPSDELLLSYLGIREITAAVEESVAASLPEVELEARERDLAKASEREARAELADVGVRATHGRAKKLGESLKA